MGGLESAIARIIARRVNPAANAFPKAMTMEASSPVVVNDSGEFGRPLVGGARPKRPGVTTPPADALASQENYESWFAATHPDSFKVPAGRPQMSGSEMSAQFHPTPVGELTNEAIDRAHPLRAIGEAAATSFGEGVMDTAKGTWNLAKEVFAGGSDEMPITGEAFTKAHPSMAARTNAIPNVMGAAMTALEMPARIPMAASQGYKESGDSILGALGGVVEEGKAFVSGKESPSTRASKAVWKELGDEYGVIPGTSFRDNAKAAVEYWGPKLIDGYKDLDQRDKDQFVDMVGETGFIAAVDPATWVGGFELGVARWGNRLKQVHAGLKAAEAAGDVAQVAKLQKDLLAVNKVVDRLDRIAGAPKAVVDAAVTAAGKVASKAPYAAGRAAREAGRLLKDVEGSMDAEDALTGGIPLLKKRRKTKAAEPQDEFENLFREADLVGPTGFPERPMPIITEFTPGLEDLPPEIAGPIMIWSTYDSPKANDLVTIVQEVYKGNPDAGKKALDRLLSNAKVKARMAEPPIGEGKEFNIDNVLREIIANRTAKSESADEKLERLTDEVLSRIANSDLPPAKKPRTTGASKKTPDIAQPTPPASPPIEAPALRADAEASEVPLVTARKKSKRKAKKVEEPAPEQVAAIEPEQMPAPAPDAVPMVEEGADWVPSGPGGIAPTYGPEYMPPGEKAKKIVGEGGREVPREQDVYGEPDANRVRGSAAQRLAEALSPDEAGTKFLRSAEDKAQDMLGEFEPVDVPPKPEWKPKSAEELVAERGARRVAEQRASDAIRDAERRAKSAERLAQESISADENALLAEQVRMLDEENARLASDKYIEAASRAKSPAQKLSGTIGRPEYSEAFEMLRDSDPGFVKFLDQAGFADPEAMTTLEKIEAVTAYRRSPFTRQQAMAEASAPRTIDEALRWLDENEPPPSGPINVPEGDRINVDYEDLLESTPAKKVYDDAPIEVMPGRYANKTKSGGLEFDPDYGPDKYEFSPEVEGERRLDELTSLLGDTRQDVSGVNWGDVFGAEDAAGDFGRLYRGSAQDLGDVKSLARGVDDIDVVPTPDKSRRFRDFFGNMDEKEIFAMSDENKAKAMADFEASIAPKASVESPKGWRPPGQESIPPKGGPAAKASGAASQPPGATASQSGPPNTPPASGGGGGGGSGPTPPGGSGPAGGFTPPPGSPTAPSDEVFKALRADAPPPSGSFIDKLIFNFWNRARALTRRKLDKAVKAFDALPAFNDALGQAFDNYVGPAFRELSGHEYDTKAYLLAGTFRDRAKLALVEASRTSDAAKKARLQDVGNWWIKTADDAQRIIVNRLNAKQPGLGDKLVGAQEALNRFVREEGLNRLVAVNGIAKESVDKMQAAHPNYMRFEVLERSDGSASLLERADLETLEKYRKTGIGAALKDEQLHLIDPLNETFDKVTDIRRAAEKTHVQNELLDNYADAQGWKRLMSKEEADKLGLKPGEYWDEKGARPSATEFKEMTRRVADASSERGWRTETWLVPHDIAATMENISPQKFGLFRNIFNEVFKNAVTTFNPAFAIRNIQRDWHSAFANASVYKPKDILSYTFRDYPRAFAKAIAYTYFPNSKMGKDVAHAIASGMGFGFTGTMRQRGTATRALFPKLRTKMWHSGWNPLEAIQRLTATVELAPRMAVFEKAKSLGLTDLDSALMAKAATIDYNAGGVIAKAMNEWVPFLNARIQGKRSMFNALAKDPKGTLMKMAITHGTMAVTAYAINSIFFSDLVAEVPDHIKEKYHFMVTGSDKNDPKTGKPIPIVWLSPKDEAGGLTTIVENGLDALRGKHPKEWFSLMVQVLHDFGSPVDFMSKGKLDPASAIATVVGPQATGIYEAYTGTRADGRPVIPYELQDKSKYAQFEDDTPGTYKWLADNPLNPEGRTLNVSPISMQRVAEGFFGPWGRLAGSPQGFVDNITGAVRREVGGGTARPILDVVAVAKDEKTRAEYKIGQALERGDMIEATKLRDEWAAMIPQLAEQFKDAGAEPYQIEAFVNGAHITDRQLPGLVEKEKIGYVDRRMGVKREDVPYRENPTAPPAGGKKKRDMKAALDRIMGRGAGK